MLQARISRSILFLFLAAITSFAQTQKPPTHANPGYTISVAVPPGPFRLPAPIDVTITAINVSGKDLYWHSATGMNSELPYKLFRVLLTKDGREVETTVFHRKITGRQRPGEPADVESSRTILLARPPGKMFEITINLKRLYEITEPGRYMLVASRFDDYTKETVQSNTVTLTIVSYSRKDDRVEIAQMLGASPKRRTVEMPEESPEVVNSSLEIAAAIPRFPRLQ